ncbi:MAG: hypothetical protein ACLFUG_02525 [Nitriliruptoraceae bacterium]
MRSRVLAVLLGLSLLIAITPAIIWAVAVVFTQVDDQLRDALGFSAYSVPIALGLAAVTLALHGLLLNAAIQDTIEDELDDLRDALEQRAAVPVDHLAAAGGSEGQPAGSDAEHRGGVAVDERVTRTARSAPPKRRRSDRIRRRAQGIARAEFRRKTGF